jgi:hypothetical protein
MADSYLFIENRNGLGNVFIERDPPMIVRHSTDTNHYIVIHDNGKKMAFSFKLLNGVYFVNLNGTDFIDYKKFKCIQRVTVSPKDENGVLVRNSHLGDIEIPDCDVETFQKGLEVMSVFMKTKNTLWSNVIHFLFY